MWYTVYNLGTRNARRLQVLGQVFFQALYFALYISIGSDSGISS